MITLRVATREDLDEIFSLDRSCSPVYSSPSPYANHLSSTDVLCVAVTEDGLVGFALWNQVVGESTLLNLAVLDRCRRLGIAKRLLVYGESLLKDAGVQRVMLEVRAGNVAALELYQSLAFTIDGHRKNYYSGLDGGPRETAVLMSKELEVANARA